MKKLALVLVVVFIASAMCVNAFAAEQENGFAKFWRGVFQWPFNAAKDSAKVVGDTGVKAVGTVADEGKAIGGTLTGEEGAAEKVVTNPVVGTAETVKTGVVGTGEMPGKATEESWPANK
ncbi:MAG: hypothetical protein PHR74_03745 [Candidatus Omnitrophica bacterium]|jgi:hypothetical protein|nr:hypothetical protein [Candidatus Omnitrophota bacterium]